jgi:hypothetical protein
MPTTPIYQFPFEAPTDKPGISITGVDGNDILAEEVELALSNTDSSVAALNNRVSTIESTGYRYLETVRFTAGGNFVKATYSGIRAVRVQVVGGGGQSGGVLATGAGQVAEGGGGGGGGYAESFLLETALAASVAVTVGAGGSGAGAGSAGNAGGSSSFGALLSATGGAGGSASSATSGDIASGIAAGGVGSLGNILNLSGGVGGGGVVISGFASRNSTGGSSYFAEPVYTSAVTSPGAVGANYGGGAGGTRNAASQAAQAGAAGGPGIVLVHVFI